MALEALFDAAPSGKVELSCSACGKRFLRYRSQIRDTVENFCSVACRNTGRHFPCTGCGKPVYRKRYQIDRIESGRLDLWCSKDCAFEHRTITRTCANCGKDFRSTKSLLERGGRGAYCSRECKDSHGRVMVCCAWPGCFAEMPARTFRLASGHIVYKTELTRKGSYNRFPMCQSHRDICRDHLGDDFRPNGRLRWLEDAEHDMGSRTLNSKITRLVIFFKSDGCCAECGAKRSFDKTDDWHIDHKVPVFRGGKTNFHNLQMLCVECHDRKTASEKSEVALLRGKLTKLGRWMTHSQKDALIAQLRAEIEDLKAQVSRAA